MSFRHHSTGWFRRITGVVGELELSVLVAAALIVVGSWVFLVIAGLVVGGGTQEIDEQLMRSLRTAADPAVLIGPPWLREVAADITALGGGLILTMLTTAVAGFVLLHRRYGAFVLLLLAALGGAMVNVGLKQFFGRGRPTIVPQLVAVSDASFPSGHAMSSATIYLSLAVLLAGVTASRRDRAYILGIALVLSMLIGISRVVLGVHYPSDVLAGWTAGIVWALVCWLTVRTAPPLLARLGRRR